MTAAEKVAQRLDKLNQQRAKEQTRIEERVMKYRETVRAAEKEMERTKDNPETIRAYIIAKQQKEEAEMQIAAEKARWQDLAARKEPAQDPEETRDMLRELRAGAIAENLEFTRRALELSRAMFALAKEAYTAQLDRDNIVDRWRVEVDPDLPPVYCLDIPRVLEKITAPFTKNNWLRLYGPGILPDENSPVFEEELKRLQAESAQEMLPYQAR